ncbi:MAG: hypothetical protein AAFS07_18695 [Pseudomonadota bacterium]
MDRAPPLKQRVVVFRSSDRDRVEFPETNAYEIDVPEVANSAGFRLASFEMQAVPQFTFREGVNDEVHFSGGAVLGGQVDPDGLYENELRIEVADVAGNALDDVVVYVPPYDLQATLVHDALGGAVVHCDGAHGLASDAGDAAVYDGPPVHLLVSSQGRVLLADGSGLAPGVAVQSATTLYLDGTVVTSAGTGAAEGAVVHCRALGAADLASIITTRGRDLRRPTSRGSRLSAAVVDGRFDLRLEHTRDLAAPRVRASVAPGFRGLGTALGRLVQTMAPWRRSARSWRSASQVDPPRQTMRFPGGLYDVGDLGTALFDRINGANLARNRVYGDTALQVGVTTHLGTTHAVRLPAGHYGAETLGAWLGAALETAVVPALGWSCAYDPSGRAWTIANGSGAPFTLHLNPGAEPGTGWATGGAAPPTNPAVAGAAAARLLGFYPNTSVPAPGGAVRSVRPAGLPDEIAAPVFRNAHDAVLEQEPGVETRRRLHFTTLVVSRDPGARKVALSTRNDEAMDVTLSDASSFLAPGVGDASAVLVGVTTVAVVARGFSAPLPVQVGQVVGLGNGATGLDLTGQVVVADASTAAVRVDSSAWAATIDGAAGPWSDFRLLAVDAPVLDVYRTSTAAARVGLAADLLGVQDFSEMQAMWNLDHDTALYLSIEPIGVSTRYAESLVTREAGTTTVATARIPVRTTGINHVNTLGAHELMYDGPQTLRRVRVRLSNADGTAYQSNRVDHTIALVVNYQ